VRGARSLGGSLALATVLFAKLADAQGSIIGHIAVLGTGDPVRDVMLTLVSGGRVACSDENGAFTFRNVRAGTATVKVFGEGYGAQSKQVPVVAGANATLDFELERVIVRVMSPEGSNKALVLRRTRAVLFKGINLSNDVSTKVDEVLGAAIDQNKLLDQTAAEFPRKTAEIMDSRNATLLALLPSETNKTRFRDNLRALAFCKPSD
jgi:hypothetical protein